MKRSFIAGALALAAISHSYAADLPPSPPPVRAPVAYIPPAPVYNWTGFYIGINGGYGFGSSNWTDAANPVVGAGGSTGNFNINGGVVGGTVGANAQFGAGVFGVEGDIDYSTIKGSISPGAPNFCSTFITAPAVFGATCNTQNNWLATVRARGGVAADRVLFFLTGGLAAGNVQAGLSGGTIGSTTYQSNTEFGWTAGAGVEVAFTPNWTAKVEYLYVDLSKMTCNTGASCGFDNAAAPFVTPANDSVKFTTSLVRLGVNYKF